LTGETTRTLMDALRQAGALERSALRRCVPYVSEATFDRSLRSLVESEIVVSRPLESDHRRRADELTQAGRDLLEIAEEIEAVEMRAPAGLRSPSAPPLLSVVADAVGRLIMRELLIDRALSFTELRSLLPELAHGTFADHLVPLTEGGLMRVLPGSRPEEHCYELSELALALARGVALSARFRRRITPRGAPWMSGDLPSLVKLLLRTQVRTPRHVNGAVLLHVRAPTETERGWSDVEVALADGRLSLRSPGTREPRARVRASPLAWCDALLDGDLAGIEIEGDGELAHTLLAALAVALHPRPRA
jgi:DNA-binding HxlR family transcriptional regulator